MKNPRAEAKAGCVSAANPGLSRERDVGGHQPARTTFRTFRTFRVFRTFRTPQDVVYKKK